MTVQCRGNRSERRAVEAERARLRRAYPAEFADGACCGLSGQYLGDRERGGYPRGFAAWPQARRNAWFAGFNLGYQDRQTGRYAEPVR